MDRTKSCGELEYHESDASSSISSISEDRQMNVDENVQFVDENARMSFFEDDENSMELDNVHLHIDENTDSGLGSMSKGRIANVPSPFNHLLSSPDSTSNIAREFSAIMELSTENLVMDLSDHEKETISSLDFLEKVETPSPARRRFGLQDVTNCRHNLSSEHNSTPCKSSPLVKRVRKLFDRKRSCILYKNVPSTFATNSQLQNRNRRSAFLKEKRVSPEGIPAAARPIRRIQSTSILESSFNSDCLSPEFVEHYSLRTVEKPFIEDTAFRSIDGQTLAELLNSFSMEQFLEKFILIDCRYPFEYDGGHVKNARNVYQREKIQPIFYPEEFNEFQKIKAKIPIFYCEFSQKRGPTMARELRSCDRKINQEQYPHLDYPEIYVLDHGYRRFFENGDLHHLCEPQHYVPMVHPAHNEILCQFRQHRRRR